MFRDDSRFMDGLRFVCGLAMVPAVLALSRAFFETLAAVPGERRILSLDRGVVAFLAGFGAFCVAFAFLPRPTRAYVWAHEMTHALFARLHGARVRNLKIHDDGGSVQLSHAHTLTLLAPYFFPLYSVLITLSLAAFHAWVPGYDLRIPGLIVLGVSWGFHFCFTVGSLLQHQTDLEHCGFVFSYALIAFLNLVFLACGLLAANAFASDHFLGAWWQNTGEAYSSVLVSVRRYGGEFRKMVRYIRLGSLSGAI